LSDPFGRDVIRRAPDALVRRDIDVGQLGEAEIQDLRTYVIRNEIWRALMSPWIIWFSVGSPQPFDHVHRHVDRLFLVHRPVFFDDLAEVRPLSNSITM